MLPMCHAMSRKCDKLSVLRMAVQHITSLRGSTATYAESSHKPSLLSEDELKHIILEAAGGFLFVVGCDLARILFVSESVNTILHYSRNELIGQSLFDYIHPLDIGMVKEQFSPANLTPRERLIDAKTLMSVKTEMPQQPTQMCSGARRSFFCRMKYRNESCENMKGVKTEQDDTEFVQRKRNSGYLKSWPTSKINISNDDDLEDSCTFLSCLVAVGQIQTPLNPNNYSSSSSIARGLELRPMEYMFRISPDGQLSFTDQAFGDWNNDCFPPRIGEVSYHPNLIKYIKKCRETGFRFGDWNNDCFPPRIGEVSYHPNLIKYIKKCRETGFRFGDWNNDCFPPRIGEVSYHPNLIKYIKKCRETGFRTTAVLGYLPQELLGTSVYEYYHQDDITRMAGIHRKVLDSKKKIQTGVYRFKSKTGSFLHVQSTCFSFRNPWTKDVEYIVCANCIVPMEEVNGSGQDYESAGVVSLDADCSTVDEMSGSTLHERMFEPGLSRITKLNAGRIGRQIADEMLDNSRETRSPQVVDSTNADICDNNLQSKLTGCLPVNHSQAIEGSNPHMVPMPTSSFINNDPNSILCAEDQIQEPNMLDQQTLEGLANPTETDDSDEAEMSMIMSLLEADAGLGGPIDFNDLPSAYDGIDCVDLGAPIDFNDIA